MLTLLWYTKLKMGHIFSKKKKKKPLGPSLHQKKKKKKKKLKKKVINILPEQSLKLGTFSCQNDP